MPMTKNSAAVAEQHQELVSISDGIAKVEIAPAGGGALASYRWRQNGSGDAEILPTRHVLPPAGSNPTTGFGVSETDFDTVFTG
ncbi:hypothetical protein [Mesorhizobium sp. M1406]|uniref:hypothetical protein n=1 Tax=Mesorhizobium sp. M1406 TaxID=2957099 RepID=UPI00333B7890